MKKVGILIALLLLIAPAVASAQLPIISIESAQYQQQVPFKFQLPVYISNVENATGVNFNLTFDPNIVNVVNISANETFFNLDVWANINNETGFANVAVVVKEPITTTDLKPLVDIEFKAVNYGYTNLNFSFAEYSLGDFNTTDINKVNGTITVQKPFYFNVQGNARILWNVSYENSSLLEIADLNDDGKDDVIFANGSGNTYNVYALDGSNGNGMWNVSLGSDKPYFAKADDLNGDGKKDVIVIAEKTIVGIRNDGDEFLIFYHNDSISFSEEMTYAVDVDGDGFKEIITGGWDSSWNNYYVIAIDSGYNNEKWVRKFGGWTQIIASNNKESPVKLANVVNVEGYFKEFNFDFDKDGKGDVLLYYWKYIGDGQYEKRFEAIDGENGNTIWVYNTTDEVYFHSKSGDSNGDGYEDLLLGGENKWIILSGKDGKVLRGMDQQLVSGCYDIDKDGVCEFLTYENGTVYIRDGSGDVEWNFNFGNYSDIYALKTFVVGEKHYWENETTYLKIVKLEQDDYGHWLESWTFEKNFTGHLSYYATITDLTGDGIEDLLFMGHYSHVLALDGANGNELWFRYVYNLAYIGDFDGDGKSDVFNVTEITHGEYAKSGEGLTGDNLAYIFNVLTSDYFEWYFDWFNPFKTYDVNGDGYKDLVFIVNPYSPDSKIYAVGVKQPPTPMPDLTVEISVPSSVKKGASVAINVTVKNIGSAKSNPTTLDLYIDGNKVETFDVPQLNAGDKKKFSHPYPFASEGTHEIKAIVDPNDEVKERNENNNVIVKSIEVYAPKPDLIGILHVYDEFGNETDTLKIHKAGDTWNGETYDYPFVVVNATFEIRNLNPDTTVDKTFKMSATYKDNSFDYELTDEQLNDLNADGVLYINDTVVADASNIDIGCYSFSITVDSTNVIDETNEMNNSATYTVCLSKPDLVPILNIPEETVPGTYEFTVGVKNIGDVWAKATKLKVYVNGTQSDEYEYNVPILIPGNVWTNNISYDFSGDYGIKVIADYYDEDTELNEENNTIVKTVSFAYRVVNATLITNVSETKYGDLINVSLIFETSHPVGSFQLKLYHDSRLAYVSSSSIENVTVTEDGWKWMNGRWFKVTNIEGSGLNINGTLQIANIKFRVTTDRERIAPLNLSGEIRDTNGVLMLLNSTNTTVHILKYTDVAPYIWGYPWRIPLGENITFKVTVRNLKGIESNPFNLTVEIFNESDILVHNWTKRIDPIPGWGYNTTEFIWKPVVAGSYYIVAKVDNDTYTVNNIRYSGNITVKQFKVDAWELWYPWWKIEKDNELYVNVYMNSTAYACGVNVTINVPEGLLVYNYTNDSWENSYTVERCLWESKWNWQSFRIKAAEIGKYGNGTDKEINVTIEWHGKILDEINSTIPKDPTDWIPNYPLVVYVPTITLYSVNTTMLDNSTDSSSMTFKTIDVNNVTTFEQNITIVVLAGQEGRILRGLDYLVHYPYGCVEQTTSTMLGALHTDWYYRTKGYPDVYDWNKVNTSIKAGVEKLAKGGDKGQHDNGSWSMWGWNPKGDGFYTMYASYGLGRVAEDDVHGYLVKNNLTETHVYNPSVNKGKFNFNDTIYWFAEAAKRDPTTGAIWWEPWQGTHWFFDGHLPVTSWIMVSHYQLVNEGLINDTARQIANQTMANVTKYLISVQNSDGGWNQWGDKDNPSRPSDAISTALSVWGLKLYGTPSADVNRSQIENAIERGVAWLLNNTVSAGPNKVYWRHPLESPWWNDYGRRSEATAYALIALNESRSMNNLNFTVLPATDPTMSMGVNYLIGVYRAHGSFGYTASTQAALHALTLLQAVAIESTTLNITIDGVVTKQVEVNATNPKVPVELTKNEIDMINGNGTPQDSKRRIHTVEVERVSGGSLVIVSVENKQVVARNELTWGTHYIGQRILKVGEEKGGTLVIKSLDSETLAEEQSDIIVKPELPNKMIEEQSYEVKIRLENKKDSAMLSPIIKVSLEGAKFDENVTPKWFDSELGWFSFTQANMNITSNYTVEFFPDQIPPNGYIDIVFNATVESGSSNVSVEVSLVPMYNEELTYVSSSTKSVIGYGDILLKVFYLNGSTASGFDVKVDGKSSATAIKALEGKHTIKVVKSDYVPVEFNVDLSRGDNITYSIILAKPDELETPKVLFAKTDDIAGLNNSMTLLKDIEVTPNATVKASRSFGLSVSGTGSKIIAVKMPKLEGGGLWAWLNDSVKIEVNGQSFTPKEVVIGDEKVLLLEIEGSASVNMSFEGRMMGDIPGTTEGVDIADAMFIAQYDVGLRNFDNKAMVYADIPGTTPGVDIADAMFIAQYDVGLRNADYLSYS